MWSNREVNCPSVFINNSEEISRFGEPYPNVALCKCQQVYSLHFDRWVKRAGLAKARADLPSFVMTNKTQEKVSKMRPSYPKTYYLKEIYRPFYNIYEYIRWLPCVKSVLCDVLIGTWHSGEFAHQWRQWRDWTLSPPRRPSCDFWVRMKSVSSGWHR